MSSPRVKNQDWMKEDFWYKAMEIGRVQMRPFGSPDSSEEKVGVQKIKITPILLLKLISFLGTLSELPQLILSTKQCAPLYLSNLFWKSILWYKHLIRAYCMPSNALALGPQKQMNVKQLGKCIRGNRCDGRASSWALWASRHNGSLSGRLRMLFKNL